MIKANCIVSEKDIQIINNSNNFKVKIEAVYNNNDISIYDIKIKANTPKIPESITLKWKIPAHNIKGVWKPTSDFSKRIQADWELDHMESRISIDAPVICLFGHDDNNRHTFACSNAINKLDLNACIREEDDCFYCHVTLFTERQSVLSDYNIQIRIDASQNHFSEAIKGVSQWWETLEGLKPVSIPDIALKPLYSSWYQFHQNLDADTIIEECKIAYDLGYEAIIIDDGWQTNDNNRGYDYTGDWKPERLTKPRDLVDALHDIGMKVGFWYSVPFCGNKSVAYKCFKGKFLTEDHRWAPVLDPRYPEVRNYLIDIYKSALVDWDLDGFKLDFIDDFRLYPDTIKEKAVGMDFHSINEAVDRLMTDIIETLSTINPEIFIEFRQKYTGPAMRKYGNMFRAFDCPGDSTMNRVRIADLKMLSGNTAVHSDMITWHNKETIEVAALQLVNVLFGVPQISVELNKLPKAHIEMIKFYTQYWNKNRTIITKGNFIPYKPLANYPIQQVSLNSETIIGVYDDYVLTIEEQFKTIDIVNGKLSTTIIIKAQNNWGTYNSHIFDCRGKLLKEEKEFDLNKGVQEIIVPPCGLIKLTQK